MFVQYSFVEKHAHPDFKREPIRFGPVSVVVIGIMAMAMAGTTLAYILL